MVKVKVQRNGPLLVSGVRSVTRLSDGRSYEVSGTAALCRCGGSRNKPFCDGTHGKVGFRGDREADGPADRRDAYAAAGIVIHDNRALCAHAGRCTEGLPAVFRLGKEPWIDPGAAPPDEVARTIRRCPSGALSYTVAGTEHRDHGGDPAVAFVPGGPYLFRGGAEIEGAELLAGGTPDHFTFCRCGRSKSKPFCSGAHWDARFDEDAPGGSNS